MPPEAALMRASGVNAGYGTMQVLWGVDLDVRPGETVLLLGANGAGKTTFLKTLVGLIEARDGVIPRAGAQPPRRPAQDARHRQGAGSGAAAPGDGRAVGGIVAAVRQGSHSRA